MKIIKGFENEDIIVSDFGEWVGKDYIDYKAEYKRNQKFIEILLDENKQLKENWNKLKKDIGYELLKLREPNEYNNGLCNAFNYINNKMQELEQGSDK